MSDDEPIELTVEQAIAMLPDTPYIHAFKSTRFLLFQSHYAREEMIAIITKAEARELAGKKPTAMKHGLAIDDGGVTGWLFVATR